MKAEPSTGWLPRRATYQSLDFVLGLFAFTIGLSLVLLREQLIPIHFRFDSEKIRDSAQGTFFNDPSFDTVGAVYRALGLADQPLIAGLVGYFAYVGVMLLAVKRSAGPSLYRSVVFAVSVVLAGVYLGEYSKDVFVLSVVAAVIISGRALVWDVLIVSLIIVYAITFRQYWLLVAVIFVGYRLVLMKHRGPIQLLLVTAVAVVATSVVVWLVLGVNPDAFRVVTNESRGDIATSTVIEPFFAGPQPLFGILNNLTTMLALIFPWPLLLRASPYYIAIAAMLLTIWIGFIRAAITVTAHAEEGPRRRLLMRSVALTLSFLVVQSLFEPDYGSALRHLVPILPLAAVAALTPYSSAEPRARSHSTRKSRVIDARPTRY